MARKFDPEEGPGEITWGKRKKVTTSINLNHFISLKEASEILQIPMGGLIDQALNDFLASVGLQKKPAVIPIDKEAIRERLSRAK